MANISNKIADRLIAGVKRFQPILAAAKTHDVSEADTMAIVRNMLAEVFGYDMFTEITAEHSIRGTYCDLAIRFDEKVQTLIEGKAIGHALKDSHVTQAIGYAVNQGTEWVVLTNGLMWRIYRVVYTQPIDKELVVEIDFCGINPKDKDHLSLLFLLTKEGWAKSALGDFHTQKQALSRFVLAATIISDPVVDIIRRELKRAFPEVKIDKEQMRKVILQDVLKRDVVEGEKADDARKKMAKVQKTNHDKPEKETVDVPPAPPAQVSVPAPPPIPAAPQP
jgi:predicted type IV restriction endonuclease